MVDFNGSLYVSLCTGTPENMPDSNTMQSFALVRGDQAEDGSWSWTSVIGDQEKDGARYTFGIDPERTRAGAGVLTVWGEGVVADCNSAEDTPWYNFRDSILVVVIENGVSGIGDSAFAYTSLKEVIINNIDKTNIFYYTVICTKC